MLDCYPRRVVFDVTAAGGGDGGATSVFANEQKRALLLLASSWPVHMQQQTDSAGAGGSLIKMSLRCAVLSTPAV